MEINHVLNKQLNLLIKNLSKSIKIIETIDIVDMIGGSSQNIVIKDSNMGNTYNIDPIIIDECNNIFNLFGKEKVKQTQFIKDLKDNKELQQKLKVTEYKKGEFWQNSKNYLEASELFSKINNLTRKGEEESANRVEFDRNIFNKYCDREIMGPDHELFDVKSSEELIENAKKSIKDVQVDIDSNIKNNLNKTKNFLMDAKTLANTVKDKLNNGEIFTKFECDGESDPHKCKKETLERLAQINTLFDINVNVENAEDLKLKHKNACSSNDLSQIKDLEKKLRNLGYLAKC